MRTERCVWDGWLCAAKLDGAQTEAYVWRVDIAGSLGGTGGVGGLAAVLDLNSETGTVSGAHFPAYDGNGNVMALVSEMSGYAYLTARYEYDPFGNELRRSGSQAENNPWRFSTKWTDRESGLSYYGFRYYDPAPRDPSLQPQWFDPRPADIGPIDILAPTDLPDPLDLMDPNPINL
ncbi:MAG TPA: RHS repeat-associated core domain-containing protein [Verrucomicrobiales bacterium]|nr:RHS repeat-associated core domain-containing protein [Verrucomicrobiales bacterium]